MNRSKKPLVVALSITFIILLAPATLSIYVDPFAIFHKSVIPGMGLMGNQNFQNAGLINNYLSDSTEGYDSVIIGSSLSQNFSREDAARYLGWKKTLRLNIDGGEPDRQTQVLSKALATGRVNHVLWEMNPRTYSPPRYSVIRDDSKFPSYLYNNQRIDDIRYLFNMDVLYLSWKYGILRKDFPGFTPDIIGFWGLLPASDTTYAQFNSPESIRRETEAYEDQKKFGDATAENVQMSSDYPVIEQFVFPLLDDSCNTDLEIIIYIPPVLKIDYLGSPLYRYRVLGMIEKISRHIAPCKNYRLHAFGNLDFTGDMNHYMDKIHYRPYVNTKLLEWMGDRSGIITPDNFEDYRRSFLAGLDSYTPFSSYPEQHQTITDRRTW